MYAVLHPPNFAAQVVAQQRPELRKRAFALIDGEPPADTVVSANKAAPSRDHPRSRFCSPRTGG